MRIIDVAKLRIPAVAIDAGALPLASQGCALAIIWCRTVAAPHSGSYRYESVIVLLRSSPAQCHRAPCRFDLVNARYSAAPTRCPESDGLPPWLQNPSSPGLPMLPSLPPRPPINAALNRPAFCAHFSRQNGCCIRAVPGAATSAAPSEAKRQLVSESLVVYPWENNGFVDQFV
jgi:hypothetical protein